MSNRSKLSHLIKRLIKKGVVVHGPFPATAVTQGWQSTRFHKYGEQEVYYIGDLMVVLETIEFARKLPSGKVTKRSTVNYIASHPSGPYRLKVQQFVERAKQFKLNSND